MPVLAVIPARLAATRLPNKPLRLLGGLPLVVRVYERVMSLDIADACIVATDADEVVRACADAGINAVLTSPDHPSGTDRVAEVASRTAFAEYNIIVNVQGDEPFVSRAAVAGAVAIVASGRAPVGTACVHADRHTLSRRDVVKVVRSDQGQALYFSRAAIPFLREDDDATLRDTLIRQHIGVYAYTRDALQQWVSWPTHPLERIERLEQLRPLAHGLVIGVADTDEPPEGGIDTEDDLLHANARWTILAQAMAVPTPPVPL